MAYCAAAIITLITKVVRLEASILVTSESTGLCFCNQHLEVAGRELVAL